MIKWNYISQDVKSSGYEDVLDLLKSYTPDAYKASDDVGKQEMIDAVFAIYRGKNIFPITYFNQDGIEKEIKDVFAKQVVWSADSGHLNLKFNQGQSLCRFLFPSLYDVDVKGVKNSSPYYRFHNDHKLKTAIKFCFKFKKNCGPTALKDALEMIGGGNATNFKAMNAKALYQAFCEKGDVVLDYSAGFGGRMLGALSAGVNYIGIEPCTETYDGLCSLGRNVKNTIPLAPNYVLFKTGSEDDAWMGSRSEFIDFAFSSPPYFNLESYSDEDTQCYVKYPELELWFENYVKPTIQNIYKALKTGKHYAVNIADFKVGTKQVQYVDRWIEISKDVGFEFVSTIDMKINNRCGSPDANVKAKQEGIFVFKKI